MMRRLVMVLVIAVASYLSVGVPASAASTAPDRIVYTQGNSLWLASVHGADKRLIVPGTTATPFSWYQWSPDGRYLLVVQSNPRSPSSNLVVYNAEGVRLETLARYVRWSGFYPSWAENGDRVAFVGATCAQVKVAGCAHATDRTIFSVGVHGRRDVVGTYPGAVFSGRCGGPDQDPADNLYLVETDFGVTMPVLHWSIGKKPAVLGLMSPSSTGGAHSKSAQATAPRPMYVAVSAAGTMAGVFQRCSSTGCTEYVALVDPSSGRVSRTVGDGALPAFSPDGNTLYFVRRVAEKTLSFSDADAGGNPVTSTVYRSEIWRARADGTHAVMILSENAYGFGPLSMTPDGRSLIFSRVDNDTALWAHRLPGGGFNAQLIASYGPTVSVQGLNLATGVVRTLIKNAGRPAA